MSTAPVFDTRLEDDGEATLPEQDRALFSARDDDAGEPAPAPLVVEEPWAGDGAAHGGRMVVLLLATVLVVVLDPLTEGLAGADTGVWLLLALPIYWAIRKADRRIDLLIVSVAVLVPPGLLLLPFLRGEGRWMTYAAALVRLAFLAAVVALGVTRRRLAAARTAAMTDSLTGVANRRGFLAAVAREAERSRRNGRPMTLLYLDCDGFKAINDALGHAAGNEVLVEAAAVLKGNVRVVDVVGRLGGDEFAVLLTETSADGSTSVIARLQSHLQARLGASAGVTFSIGAVTCETPPDDVDDVIRAADAAMYRAKRAGKGRVERVVVAAAEGRRGSKGARG